MCRKLNFFCVRFLSVQKFKKKILVKDVYMNGTKIYFSEHFEIDHSLVEDSGFLDISLVCDNPAFVDPFLIFVNPKYKDLHNFIVDYLKFLRDESVGNEQLSHGQFQHYYKFPEVKQAWLGFSVDGNAGLGLGPDFANSLFSSLHSIFKNFGDEKVTKATHLEKLCLIKEGIGVDKVSDFTLNLIKSYILQRTQEFSLKNIDKKFLKEFAIEKVYFNPSAKTWEGGRFTLPAYNWRSKVDYIVLVPNDILTKEDIWISKNDFLKSNQGIFSVVSNDELREKINRFFENNLLTKLDKRKRVVKDFSSKSKSRAFRKTVNKYPVLLDYYIKQKEEMGKDALKTHVANSEAVNYFIDAEHVKEEFSKKNYGPVKSYEDCIERLIFYKQILESNASNLKVKGNHISEKNLQFLFKLTTYNSLFNYDAEVNNGRGPIDFIISMGSQDKTGLEFKLASNSKLKQNLKNQTEIYKVDSNLKYIIKVVFFFTSDELEGVNGILKELGDVPENEKIILIDCREKESASNVK